MPNDRPAVRVELYVRSLAPTGAQHRQETVLDRLDDLARADAIAEYDISIWGRRIRPSMRTTDPGRAILARIDAFREWADRADVSLNALEVRSVESAIVEESYSVVVLPAMALAEYRGGDLVHVAPHEAGGRTTSVTDRLAELERRASPVDRVDGPRATPSGE